MWERCKFKHFNVSHGRIGVNSPSVVLFLQTLAKDVRKRYVVSECFVFLEKGLDNIWTAYTCF